MKYTHIVFDIDGTLLDTEYAVLHSLQDTLREMSDMDIPISDLTFCLGITGADALEILKIPDKETVLSRWEKNLSGYQDTIRIFPGLTRLLDALSARGYELGIITSKTKKEFEEEFCSSGIRDYFHHVVCSDDTTEHKPSPAPIQKYMEISGTAPAQLLYIGDTAYDKKCSEGAGADFALAVWGNSSGNVIAKYALERPSDLLNYL